MCDNLKYTPTIIHNGEKNELTQIFIKKCEDKFGIGIFDFSNTHFINNKTIVKFSCKKNNHEILVLPTSILQKYRTTSCFKCDVETKNQEKLINFILAANAIHNNKYDYSLITKEIHSKINVKIICFVHGIFEKRASRHLKIGGGCQKCLIRPKRKLSKPIKKKTNKLLNAAIKKYKDKFDYSLVDKETTLFRNTELKIICKTHGVFKVSLRRHIDNLYGGCKQCYKSGSHKNALDSQKFINRAREVHNNRYDYSLVEYNNFNTPVKIICSRHGIFEQTPQNHLRGSNCPTCSSHLTTEEFICRAKKVHSDSYDYSLVDYRDTRIPIKIICRKHGIFEQIPNSHLQGSGCLRCCKNRATTEQFIIKVQKIHDNTYDYSLVDYYNSYTKVKIVCRIHGCFEQRPDSHTDMRAGCPACTKYKRTNISKMENDFLNTICLPDTPDHRQVPLFTNVTKSKECLVDGYDPLTNTVFLFHGDFWHGNPRIYLSDSINQVVGKSYGDLYKKTLAMENDLNERHRVFSIWEDEYKIQKEDFIKFGITYQNIAKELMEKS